jgi:protein SCO1/2
VAVVSAAAVLPVGAQGLTRPVPAAAAKDQAPILRKVRFDQNLNASIPLDLTFRDENGNQVPLRRYFGAKPVVLAMVYYECPMLCTLVMNGEARAFQALRSLDVGQDFEAVAVSINPKEGPALAAAKKATYVAQCGKPGAAAGWHFLTGTDASIRPLADAIGFHYAYDPASGQYAHPSGIVVLTPEGKIARYLYGVDYSPRDLELSLVEASQNKIGSPVDQLLLCCFRYDPVTGKYTATVVNVLKVAGALTVVLLAAGIVFLTRRGRLRASLASR